MFGTIRTIAIVGLISTLLGSGVYAVKRYINMQLALEATKLELETAKKQEALNADLQIENEAYQQEINSLKQVNNSLVTTIREGNSDEIQSIDGPLGNVLRVIGLRCGQSGEPTSPESDTGAKPTK